MATKVLPRRTRGTHGRSTRLAPALRPGWSPRCCCSACWRATVGLGTAGWVVGRRLRAWSRTRCWRAGSPTSTARRLGPRRLGDADAGDARRRRRRADRGLVRASPRRSRCWWRSAPSRSAWTSLDGFVARRTGTASALGARFDGEVDAFLIVVLSVYVAPAVGWWVLAIGAARYLFLVGEWALPWMRAPLPPRYWRKVVAAAQGITLTVVAADVLPLPVNRAVLAAALDRAGRVVRRDVWWLWRRREANLRRRGDRRRRRRGGRAARRGPVRTGLAVLLTMLALLVLWVALLAPNQPGDLDAGDVRAPAARGASSSSGAGAGPAAARPPRHGLVVGPVLGVLLVVKVLDMGFFTAFDRPFNPVDDWSYAGIGIETLRESIGRTQRRPWSPSPSCVLVVALLVLPTLALLRLTRLTAGHRRWSVPGDRGAGRRLDAAAGRSARRSSPARRSPPRAPPTWPSTRAARCRPDSPASRPSPARSPTTACASTAGDKLLTGLRGKDVLLVFVESYGRVAVQGSSVRTRRERRARPWHRPAAGTPASPPRSGFLTSSDVRRPQLARRTPPCSRGSGSTPSAATTSSIESDRFTLSQAFKRAGWRTVSDVPSNNRPWPEGASVLPLRPALRPAERRLPRPRPTPTPRCPTSTS